MNVRLIFVLLSLFLSSCIEQSTKEIAAPLEEKLPVLEIPEQTIDKAKLKYNNKVSLWTLDGELFSGYALSYAPDSTLIQKIGILDGRKQSQTTDWYPDGRIKHTANYHKGYLHGEKKNWSSDSSHILLSYLNYHSGKLHGVQKKWYPTGELFKVLHLNMGREEGLQKAYRKNGVLFANYEAREGRTFGLKKAALCFGLEDEKIQK